MIDASVSNPVGAAAHSHVDERECDGVTHFGVEELDRLLTGVAVVNRESSSVRDSGFGTPKQAPAQLVELRRGPHREVPVEIVVDRCFVIHDEHARHVLGLRHRRGTHEERLRPLHGRLERGQSPRSC